MKAIPLDTNNFKAVMKVVFQLIENADQLDFPAYQAQLITNISNVLAPFGFESTMDHEWLFNKQEPRIRCFFMYWPYYDGPVSRAPKQSVSCFAYFFYGFFSAAEHKELLRKEFSKFQQSILNYLMIHG
ncbi:MAG: hypothetical protein IKX44_07380 [Prevotella sp.]|nr:hypothetical protein [Prevotella sp.]